MGTTTKTDYMLLVLPLPTQEMGPAWAAELNAALVQIDRHNHTPDNGNPILTAALQIDAALSFRGNDAIMVRSLRLANQTTPIGGATDLGCVYESGGDLWWNSATGEQVQLTSGASLNAASIGAIGGDYTSTPGAQVILVAASKKYIFRSLANTPGAIDCGPVTLRELATSPHGVTLNSPNALAADYGVTMPAALPAASRLVTLDNNGAIAAPDTAVGDNITLIGNVALTAAGPQTLLKSGSGALTIGTTIAADLVFQLSGVTKWTLQQSSGNLVGASGAGIALAGSGGITLAGGQVTGLGTTTNASDAATKSYVDGWGGPTLTWNNLSFGAGWSGVAQYAKWGGLLFLRGYAAGGGTGQTTIATLPAGYRPAIDRRVAGAYNNGSGYIFTSFLIQSDGTLGGPANSGAPQMALDGIVVSL